MVTTLGVIGAGTMGSGIALLGLRAGTKVYLYDISPEMQTKARNYLEYHLARKGQTERMADLHPVDALPALRSCQVVIEAAPENLDLKKQIFAELDRICDPKAVLVSNTSTLPITAIAAATSHPERVGGMHFFNPAPVLPLVEVIRGARTGQTTLDRMVELAKLLGKTPVVATDTPGFIVNRIARPYYGEALRLVSERIASHEQVDLLLEKSGGFRMGPFRLMDLIGIDVNFTAMRSMFEQTFGDKRYQPSLLQLQKIQENALGQKSGRGFYDYSAGQPASPSTPAVQKSNFQGAVYLSGGSWAPGMAALCRKNGMHMTADPDNATAIAIIRTGRDEDAADTIAWIESQVASDTPILCQAADITVHELATYFQRPQRMAGFDGLFAARGELVTAVPSPVADANSVKRIEAFFAAVNRSIVWVEDGPALIVPRTVAMLANEAAFALDEGLAEAATLDTAMKLGVNYPLGPLEWAEKIGEQRILALLDHLFNEYREERYRAAPYWRRKVRLHVLASRK